jgi:hypothetical protein
MTTINANLPESPGRISRSWWAFAAGLAILTFLSRWISRNEYIVSADSLQFIAGLAVGDLSLDMPHPPGAPVYLFLLKLAGLFLPGVEQAPALVGALADAGTVTVLFALGAAIFNVESAAVAALLYALSPLGWHSAASGTFFGVNSLLSSASLLCLVVAYRRQTPWTAVLAGVMPSLALGSTINPNLAAGGLLAATIWLGWKLPRPLSRRLAMGFFISAAAWFLPPFLLAPHPMKHLAALWEAYATRGWPKSPLAVVLTLGIPKGLYSPGILFVRCSLAAVKALAFATPFFVLGFLPPRRKTGAADRVPHLGILLFLAASSFFLLFLSYDSEQYVAVMFPAFCLLASRGFLRLMGYFQRVLGNLAGGSPSGMRILKSTLLLTHVFILVAGNMVFLWGLFNLDPTGSVSIHGRENLSLRDRLRKPGTARNEAHSLLPLMKALVHDTADCDGVLFVTPDPVLFNLLCLYAPGNITTLWIMKGTPVAALGTQEKWTIKPLDPSGKTPLGSGFKTVVSFLPQGGGPITIHLKPKEVGPPSHASLALGNLKFFEAEKIDLCVETLEQGFVLRGP